MFRSRRRLVIATALVASAAFPFGASADPAGRWAQSARASAQQSSKSSEPQKMACDPIVIRTSSGRLAVKAGCRLVKVVGGRVPCLQMNTLEERKCHFGRSTGRWYSGPNGEFYAKVGEALSPEGAPRGIYIVAAQAQRKGAVPCDKPPSLMARAADSSAAPAQQDLSSTCTTEVANVATNSAYRLVSWASREVCSGDRFHPDRLIEGTPHPTVPGSYCYPPGHGSALNDINGTELYSNMTYISGSQFCHFVWMNGKLVPAAKRPAAGSNGEVNLLSPIRWRGVNPNARIAN